MHNLIKMKKKGIHNSKYSIPYTLYKYKTLHSIESRNCKFLQLILYVFLKVFNSYSKELYKIKFVDILIIW